MNPIHRLILMVVRLLAVGLLLAGILQVMIYRAQTILNKTSLRPGRCAWLSIPAIVGLLMLVGSFPLAAWMRKQDDDEDTD